MAVSTMEINTPRLEEAQALVIEREFSAPRELVWQVWTETEHLKHWWGPKDYSLSVARLDLRPGGVFHYAIRSLEGNTMWGKFVYREIAAPERLVFVSSFTDEEGNLTSHPLNPSWPLEILNTLTFMDDGSTTRIYLTGSPYNATYAERMTFNGAYAAVKGGFKGTFDQLDHYLEKIAIKLFMEV